MAKIKFRCMAGNCRNFFVEDVPYGYNTKEILKKRGWFESLNVGTMCPKCSGFPGGDNHFFIDDDS